MTHKFHDKIKLIAAGALMALSTFLLVKPVIASQPYENMASSEEWDVLKETNRERLKDGKDAISMFNSLQSISHIRANEIVTLFSHQRPDNSYVFEMIRTKNISYNTAGENIAAGQTSPKLVMNSWMNSSGHRANILNNAFTHIGTGYSTGGTYGKNWVQVFVGGCDLDSVQVNDDGNAYAVGTSIDNMNRYLIINCKQHGISYAPVISEMCMGYNKNLEGMQTVTVKYKNKTVQMTVNLGKSGGSSTTEDSDKPGQVKALTVSKSSKGAAQLSWKKRAGNGYEIWCATSKNGKYKKVKTIKSSTTTKCKIKSLVSGKRYYFKIKAFKLVNGKKSYGTFSSKKSIVVK